jgi:hypothetical protein
LSDAPSSTIGAERQANPYLQHKARNDFITAVLEGLPDAPPWLDQGSCHRLHASIFSPRGPVVLLLDFLARRTLSDRGDQCHSP